MSQSMVNFRMDSGLKKEMESICEELGLSLSAAFTLFAKKLIREKRIPFDVSLDNQVNDTHLLYLREIVKELKNSTPGEAH